MCAKGGLAGARRRDMLEWLVERGSFVGSDMAKSAMVRTENSCETAG
jgi:hypothetical protein